MWYKNITGRFFGLVTKHVYDRWTDGRMDGQNYDSQDHTSIAASCGKNRYQYQIDIAILFTKSIKINHFLESQNHHISTKD